jgi:hypothetical protein
VKTLLAYILAFYILLSAVVPCTVFDQCEEEEKTEQHSATRHEKDCANCTPFSFCSTTAGFTLNAVNLEIVPIPLINSPSYSEYISAPKSEYYSSLFQPPEHS